MVTLEASKHGWLSVLSNTDCFFTSTPTNKISYFHVSSSFGRQGGGIFQCFHWPGQHGGGAAHGLQRGEPE